MNTSSAAVLCGLLIASAPASAQPTIREQPIQLETVATATIKARLAGDETIDYTLSASAGQRMVVRFKPSNLSAYFNVLPPGSSDVAIFVGSTSGNDFSANLTATGIYRIRVYLMRNAARRNESVDYTLEVALTGGGSGAADAWSKTGPAKWDASGSVKCSAGAAKLDQWCGFRVVRDLRRQAADIWIGNAASGQADYRFLHYENKIFTTSDQSRLAWQRQDDNWWVSVDGREFYLVPDALIHGG